jgi:hypothetical protein
MIGSIMRFVSDWTSGGGGVQPPPFRPQQEEREETVIEMQNLLGREDDEPNKQDESADLAIQEWKRITNVDVFLEQVFLTIQSPSSCFLDVRVLSRKWIVWNSTWKDM